MFANSHLEHACRQLNLNNAEAAIADGADASYLGIQNKNLLHQIIETTEYDPHFDGGGDHWGGWDEDDVEIGGIDLGIAPPAAPQLTRRQALAKLLIGAGSDINGRDHFLETPLHYAVRRNQTDMIEFLLDQPGIDIEAKNRAGFTPMHVATWEGHTQGVRQLLNKGADKNALTVGGRTPVEHLLHAPHKRSEAEQKEAVLNMVSAGAVPHLAHIPESINMVKTMAAGDSEVFDKLIEAAMLKPGAISKKQNPRGFQQLSCAAYVLNKILETTRPMFGKQHAPLTVTLLAQSAGNWEDIVTRQMRPFTGASARSVTDMVKEFTQYVVLPEYLRRMGDMKKIEALDSGELTAIMDGLLPKVATALMDTSSNSNAKSEENRGIIDILGLSERWHARRNTIIPHIRDRNIAQQGGWHALLPEKRFEIAANPQKNISSPLYIENLTSADELEAESANLHHCVGNYAMACKSGNSHIFSVRRAEDARPISTFEISTKRGFEPYMANVKHWLQLPHSNKKLVVAQHRGIHDRTPPPSAQAALEQFIEAVEKEKITLNLSQWGSTEKKATSWVGSLFRTQPKEREICPAVQLVGYDPLKTPEHIQIAFEQFKSPILRPLQIGDEGKFILDEQASHERDIPIYKQQRNVAFLPARFRDSGVAEFFENSGLKQHIEGMLTQQSMIR